jgi:Flp pilus assembly protein CpaB
MAAKASLPADDTLARVTVRWDQIGVGDRVAAHPIAAGEFLRPSDLAGPGVGAIRLRAMSVPVKRERAVGGMLRVGDRVDVVDVVDGTARWIVTGTQVIEVPAPPSSSGLARDVSAVYHVVVEVDADQALALAEALTHDMVSVVRSTGAPPPMAAKASLPAAPPAESAATVPPAAVEPAAATSPPPAPAPAPAPGG